MLLGILGMGNSQKLTSFSYFYKKIGIFDHQLLVTYTYRVDTIEDLRTQIRRVHAVHG